MGVGSLLGPLVAARLQADPWHGSWHAPRLEVGLDLPLSGFAEFD